MIFHAYQRTPPLMPRRTAFLTLLVLAAVTAACSTDAAPDPGTQPTPIEVTEVFEGTVTVNGAKTHPFMVERAGTVTARLTVLSDAAATVGLSLGTWNGATCAIILANDAAAAGVSVIGTAQATGQFCVRIYDVGVLAAAVNYAVDVTHF